MGHYGEMILTMPQNPEEVEEMSFFDDEEDLRGFSDADIEQAGFEADAAEAEQEAVYGKTQIHTTVEAFAEATGLSVEFIRAHGITKYNAAMGIPLHELQEDATGR